VTLGCEGEDNGDLVDWENGVGWAFGVLSYYLGITRDLLIVVAECLILLFCFHAFISQIADFAYVSRTTCQNPTTTTTTTEAFDGTTGV
jgi:hypothetical protein